MQKKPDLCNKKSALQSLTAGCRRCMRISQCLSKKLRQCFFYGSFKIMKTQLNLEDVIGTSIRLSRTKTAVCCQLSKESYTTKARLQQHDTNSSQHEQFRFDRIYSTVLLTTSLDESGSPAARASPALRAVAARLPAYHIQTHCQ